MPTARWSNTLSRARRADARGVLSRAGVVAVVVVSVWALADEVRAQGELWMRGGAAPPPGRVVAIDAQGVVIESTQDADAGPGPSRAIIPWDRIAKVEGSHAQESLAWATVADDAWRARVRMERGDLLGAEPLLEAMFAKYEGTQGPTAALVASALMRCRLQRDARASGVRAWLALVASGVPEVRFESSGASAQDPLPALVDPFTALAADLPPIWLPAPGLRLLDADPPSAVPSFATSPGEQALARARSLRAIYAASARFELGEPVALPPRPDADEGLQLAWDVVASRAGEEQDRAAALARLRVRAAEPATPAWMEAWCRVAVGRALVSSADVRERRAGIVQLAHVPARLAEPAPYLAGIALAEMAVAYAKEGRGHEAARLRSRLAERFPDHGALAWPPLRAILSPAAPAGASPRDPGVDLEPKSKPQPTQPEGQGGPG